MIKFQGVMMMNNVEMRLAVWEEQQKDTKAAISNLQIP